MSRKAAVGSAFAIQHAPWLVESVHSIKNCIPRGAWQATACRRLLAAAGLREIDCNFVWSQGHVHPHATGRQYLMP